jgi:hypothetical protein
MKKINLIFSLHSYILNVFGVGVIPGPIILYFFMMMFAHEN